MCYRRTALRLTPPARLATGVPSHPPRADDNTHRTIRYLNALCNVLNTLCNITNALQYAIHQTPFNMQHTERAMTRHAPHGQHRVRRAEPSLVVQLRADHRAADPGHPEDELARRVAVCGVLAVRAFLCSLSACLCPLCVCAHGKENETKQKTDVWKTQTRGQSRADGLMRVCAQGEHDEQDLRQPDYMDRE